MAIRGFFSGKTPREIVAEINSPCEKCKLYEGVSSPKMEASGGGNKGILIVGEAPGVTEDEQGVQFIGESGQLLERELKEYGISLHDDCRLINAVNCRPPANRTPTLKEIQCCRPKVNAAIKAFKPRFIWLLGKSAIQSFYGGRFSQTEVFRWERLCVPDKATNAWVIPMYHPSFALRALYDENRLSFYRRGLKFAASCLKKDSPKFRDPKQHIEILTRYEDVVKYLGGLLHRAKAGMFPLAFDYEASSLKPYRSADQCIWSCAMCSDENKAYAFPVSYSGHFNQDQQKAILGLLSHIMMHPNIKKVAHNLQFEDLWTRAIVGTTVKNWHWCTMNAAHVLDCREKFCGLKFQAYINFGIEGYEKELTPYMTQMHEGAQLNKLDMVPLSKLLTYNAIDALVTYWLYCKQYGILSRKYDKRFNAYQIITLPGIQALNDATVRGIRMDTAYYDDTKQALAEQLAYYERLLTRGDVALAFRKLTNRPLKVAKKDFSKKDLHTVIYDVLKVAHTKLTATGQKALDHEVLESIDNPWTKNLVRRRKLYKLIHTYLAQFTREIDPQGLMHPLFYLHTTRTYRGSSADPNFQNIPNRDEEGKAATRKGIMPRNGWRIVTADYGSQEVRVAAILSQDEKLMWYCSQDDSDMHLDIGSQIWVVDPDLITKTIRFHIKGGFVFAQIYGSYYLPCAQKLWDTCINLELKNGTTMHDHLVDIGVLSGSKTRKTKMKLRGKLQTTTYHFKQFVDHVQSIETWFWEQFKGLRDWQNRMVKVYQKHGWVEMPFGFRRTGLLSNNKIFNSAVQGTAFHLLMWSYIELNKMCRSKWDTDLMGQIHDEILYDLNPDELHDVLDMTQYIMQDKIRERFDWVNVPLIVEPEGTDVDQAWYYKRPLARNENGYWEYVE